MRKKQWQTLKDRIAAGQFGWLGRQAVKTIAVPLSFRRRRILTGPILAGLAITYRCNASCSICPQKHDDTRPELDTAAWRRIIDELAEMGTSGVVFTGGEPLLREDLAELVACAAGHGFPVSISTNGLAMDTARANELLEAGLTDISFSIDRIGDASLTGRGHTLAGVRGAIARLKDAGARRRRAPTITLTCCLSPDNLDDARKLADYCDDADLSGISFIPATRFDASAAGDKAPVITSPEEIARAEALIDNLLARRRASGRFDNSVRYLHLLRHYLRHRGLPFPCIAPFCGIYLDAQGEIFPCMGEFMRQRPVEGRDRQSLRDFWYSPEYQKHRQQLASCHACCLACHMEFNLLFAPWSRLQFGAATS